MRQMSRLFGPSLRRTTILLIGIWFCCAFSWAGFAMFLPKLMYRSNVVKSRSEVYSSMVFQQIGPIISVLLGTYLVTTRLGRKWTQSLSLALAGLFLYLFIFSGSYFTLMLSSSAFFFFLVMGYGAQYTITPESYPTDVRNTGLGFCSSVNRIAMLLAPLVSGSLIDSLGLEFGGYVAVMIYSA